MDHTRHLHSLCRVQSCLSDICSVVRFVWGSLRNGRASFWYANSAISATTLCESARPPCETPKSLARPRHRQLPVCWRKERQVGLSGLIRSTAAGSGLRIAAFLLHRHEMSLVSLSKGCCTRTKSLNSERDMSWKVILVVLVGLLSSTVKPASGQSFTLQQVMSGTFNSELQASPKGSLVVWMANQEGKRNVWVAEVGGGNFAARRLTAYTTDDGQDIGDITWTPDGRSVLYVYGGDFEFPGRPDPNPALLASGVEQTIFIVPVDGGKPRRLAEGRSPQVSPDGKTVAFLSKEGIWSVSLAGDSPKPVLMFHSRGTLGPPLWSPDGKYVAFTSNRGDHEFVGVYCVEDKTITYMDPSTQTDRYPEWSPDSR